MYRIWNIWLIDQIYFFFFCYVCKLKFLLQTTQHNKRTTTHLFHLLQQLLKQLPSFARGFYWSVFKCFKMFSRLTRISSAATYKCLQSSMRDVTLMKPQYRTLYTINVGDLMKRMAQPSVLCISSSERIRYIFSCLLWLTGLIRLIRLCDTRVSTLKCVSTNYNLLYV